jgi:hypothetical protein
VFFPRAAYWFSVRNILVALQRIIKSHELYEARLDQFKFWYTFLDTNPKVTNWVPAMSNIPSSASLTSLPPWSFLSFDALAPEVNPSCPGEALHLSHLQLYGRSVSLVFSLFLRKLTRS